MENNKTLKISLKHNKTSNKIVQEDKKCHEDLQVRAKKAAKITSEASFSMMNALTILLGIDVVSAAFLWLLWPATCHSGFIFFCQK